MFDLELSDEQQALREVLGDFAQRRLRPIGRECDDERATPDDVLAQIHAFGITGPPSGDGSRARHPTTLEYVLTAEELAFGDPGIAFAAFTSGAGAVLLAACGSDEQRERCLPQLGAPDARGSLLYFEGWGRGPSETESTAARQRGIWVVNAEKFFVAHPVVADLSIVIANDIEAGELRAYLFSGAPDGYVLGCDDRETPNSGLRAAHTGAVALRHLRVAPDDVLPASPTELGRALARIRLAIAALAIGAARAATEYAIAYAQERIAFGKPIASFQGVAFPLADADIAIDAARLSVWATATKIDRCDDPEELEQATTLTVTRTCDIMQRVARDAVQVLGGSGFIRDHPVERWWRAVVTLGSIDFDPLVNAVPV